MGAAGGVCYHKNTNAPDYSRRNASCTSGYVGTAPPTPDAPSHVNVSAGALLSTAGPNFLCWNIDASENRGFFWRAPPAQNPAIVTRECRRSLLMLQGIALVPFNYDKGLPSFPSNCTRARFAGATGVPRTPVATAHSWRARRPPWAWRRPVLLRLYTRIATCYPDRAARTCPHFVPGLPHAVAHSRRRQGSRCFASGWAPDFGGRKWVLRVRDWPSPNGVLWSWLERYRICTPHFTRKNVLILWGPNRVSAGAENRFGPQILDPRLRRLRERLPDLCLRRHPVPRVFAHQDLPQRDALAEPALVHGRGKVEDDLRPVHEHGAGRCLGIGGGRETSGRSFSFLVLGLPHVTLIELRRLAPHFVPG